jgi:hypothetical protein
MPAAVWMPKTAWTPAKAGMQFFSSEIHENLTNGTIF